MGYVFDAMQNDANGDDADKAWTHQVFSDEPVDPPPDPPSPDGEPSAASDAPAASQPPPSDEAPAPRPRSNQGRSVEAQIDERVVVVTQPGTSQAEAYRRLAGRVFTAAHNKPAIHAVTSACRKDGKTLTCLNLSMAMAESAEGRTVLIEGDLRAANVLRMCQLDETPPGLYQLLDGTASIDDVLMRPSGSNCPIIYAGRPTSGRAPGLFDTERLAEVLAEIRLRFDHVVIDTPPILDVADAGSLCAAADQVLLVVRLNQTDRELAHEALQTVQSYNSRVAGLVLTDVKPHAVPYGRHYKYGYYGYGYGDATDRKQRRHQLSRESEGRTANAA